MRVYISGAITGTDDYIERFEGYERLLTDKGYSVVNPAKVCSNLPEMTHGEYMNICLAMLGCCDLIFIIPDSDESRGVRQELYYASTHGITRLRLYEETIHKDDFEIRY